MNKFRSQEISLLGFLTSGLAARETASRVTNPLGLALFISLIKQSTHIGISEKIQIGQFSPSHKASGPTQAFPGPISPYPSLQGEINASL